MIVLGMNAFHGDASAALIVDGRLIAAAEEERFTRIKHQAGFPARAVGYCLKEAGIKLSDVHHIAISRDPEAYRFRRIYSNLKRSFKRKSFSFLYDRFRQLGTLSNLSAEFERHFGCALVKTKIHYIEHHLAHLASAFYGSGFDKAAVLSIDAFGDFVSTKWGIASADGIRVDGAVTYPHSLGIVYTAVTQYLGFPNYGDEYKVMGLAAYGKPLYDSEFEQLIRIKRDGTFKIGLDFFRHHTHGIEMNWEDGAPTLERIYSDRMMDLLGPERKPDDVVKERHQDIAASLQRATERTIFHLMHYLHKKTKMDRLCYAGGVALNALANGKIARMTPFRKSFIPPAAGDAGTALGAAWIVSCQKERQKCFRIQDVYWGSQFRESDIRAALDKSGLAWKKMEDAEMVRWTAEQLSREKIVGWFQGRMEFGPRALGNRSILIDPRSIELKERLNERIKKRESFRPFAPAVIEEEADHFFDMADEADAPFMLKIFSVLEEKRHLIPAVVHVDGTARVQTVNRRQNPLFYSLLEAFYQRTGVPVLLNTSFNEHEPIVESPEQAIACFERNHMDILAIGPYVVCRM